jgi:hypothetical protein
LLDWAGSAATRSQGTATPTRDGGELLARLVDGELVRGVEAIAE